MKGIVSFDQKLFLFRIGKLFHVIGKGDRVGNQAFRLLFLLLLCQFFLGKKRAAFLEMDNENTTVARCTFHLYRSVVQLDYAFGQ